MGALALGAAAHLPLLLVAYHCRAPSSVTPLTAG
jgi:hypothetical protein